MIFNEPKYAFVIGFCWAAFFFTVQLLLCFKVRKLSVKLIPVYFLSLCIIFCVTWYLGVFGTGDGFLNANRIGAAILAIPVGIASIGDVIAWLVYKRFRNNG